MGVDKRSPSPSGRGPATPLPSMEGKFSVLYLKREEKSFTPQFRSSAGVNDTPASSEAPHNTADGKGA
ncbi:hypothetical protein MNBD_NITROSPINAE04-542 [hydrothermal vent metagenome]|uniref:Uncharacterized protein n=1 Tax=hydrothermal vent metagenome TaxID=652676 RepID=A0A3B1C377_9ZZZZ